MQQKSTPTHMHGYFLEKLWHVSMLARLEKCTLFSIWSHNFGNNIVHVYNTWIFGRTMEPLLKDQMLGVHIFKGNRYLLASTCFTLDLGSNICAPDEIDIYFLSYMFYLGHKSMVNHVPVFNDSGNISTLQMLSISAPRSSTTWTRSAADNYKIMLGSTKKYWKNIARHWKYESTLCGAYPLTLVLRVKV